MWLRMTQHLYKDTFNYLAAHILMKRCGSFGEYYIVNGN